MAGTIYISNGVVSSGLNITNGENCFVLAGGMIQETHISSGGSVSLMSGSASATQVSSGGLFAIQNGSAVNTEVFLGGVMRVSSGAMASDVTFNNGASGTIVGRMSSVAVLSGGQISITSGANISGLIISNGGRMSLSLARDVIVAGNSAGIQLSVNNGTISNFAFASGNELKVYSGGSANNIIIAEGAYLHVYTGAYINGLNIEGIPFSSVYDINKNTTILNGQYNGKDFFVSGGTVTGMTIPAQGKLFLSSGVTATDLVFNGDSMQVTAGAKVFRSYFNGTMDEMAGIMSDTILGSDAYLDIEGGTMTDTTIEYGGRMFATSGTLSGEIHVAGTLYLKSRSNIASNTSLFLDISNHTPSIKKKELLVSSFQNDKFSSCQLIVDDKQTVGTYIISDSSQSFSDNITLTSNDIILGTLTVNGTPIADRCASYSLTSTNPSANYYQLFFTVQAAPNIVYINNLWNGLEFGSVVSIDEETSAIIGIDAFTTCMEAQNYVAYGGTIINIGTEKSVFNNGMTDAIIQGNCYANGDNLDFSKIITGKTIFCGNTLASPTPTNKTIAIDTVSAKRLFGNGVAENLEQTQNNTCTIEISGSDFSSALFGGSQIVNTMLTTTTIKTDMNVTVSNSATSLFFGNCNMISNSEHPYTVNLEGDTFITLDHVNASNFTGGGALIGSYTHEIRTGNTTLNIIGGTFSNTVFGGSLIQSMSDATSTIIGDININISGNAKFDFYLYGAGMALKVGPTRKTSFEGDITISIDVSDGLQIANGIILGGAACSKINGNGKLIFKGQSTGDTLLDGAIIIGDSAYANNGNSFFTGNRELFFENFQGVIGAKVTLFHSLYVDEDSEIEFTHNKDVLNDVVSWNISGKANHTSILFSNDKYYYDFTGSLFNLECDLEDNDTWTILKFNSVDNFQNIADAVFTLNGDRLFEEDESTLSGLYYKIEITEDGALLASKLA